MSDINSMIVDPLKRFAKDSAYLVKKCSKPDFKGKVDIVSILRFNFVKFVLAEFTKIAKATGIGFLIMGFVGFFVKIIHIPINNIIVGGMGGDGSQ